MKGLDFYDKYISRERWLYNKKILDLGCFVGGKAQLFAENRAKEVIGIDLSKREIKVVKKYERDNLKYYRISSTELKKIIENILIPLFPLLFLSIFKKNYYQASLKIVMDC